MGKPGTKMKVHRRPSRAATASRFAWCNSPSFYIDFRMLR